MRHEPPRPDMNVTPLVDVVLVLLIIFMVITPQMAAGANVDVPPASNVDEKKSTTEPLTLSVTASGNVFIEKSTISLADLPAKLKEIHARDPFRRARIKADKRTAYGFVRTVFKACQEAGFVGVGLQAGDREKAGKKS